MTESMAHGHYPMNSNMAGSFCTGAFDESSLSIGRVKKV